jgi:hypothetical protein
VEHADLLAEEVMPVDSLPEWVWPSGPFDEPDSDPNAD